MPIEKVEMYRYAGQVFETEDRAVDYAESLVYEFLKERLLGKGFTVSEAVKAANVVIDNRQKLAGLLDF